MFQAYFSIFPWERVSREAVGADIGSGSGRWAKQVAPRVRHLHLVEPSPVALEVSRSNLEKIDNVSFHLADVDTLPFEDASLDFAYSLGVLHHVPDTRKAIKSIAVKLKLGAPFLIYLYYAFDNQPRWYRWVWFMSDLVRRAISRLPSILRNVICDLIAGVIYWPLSRMALLFDKLGILPKSWPLAAYRSRSFYVLRTDALDRFGTRLEQRFTKADIVNLLISSDFSNIEFYDGMPFWTVVAIKS
jgi:SAM-dependent methyltransferase